MNDLTYDDYAQTPLGMRQRDLTVTTTYDAAYLQERYGDLGPKLQILANSRLQLLLSVLYGRTDGRQLRLLDFGCGTGVYHQIARHLGFDAWGTDLIDVGVPNYVQDWKPLLPIDVLTCFDSLEHLAEPAELIRAVNAEYVHLSVPWCHFPEDEDWFMAWKHRRPGEHLWHWGDQEIGRFMEDLDYNCILIGSPEDYFRLNPEQSEQNILTAIFRRCP